MPEVKCTKCGQDIYIDSYSMPYRGELACKGCRNVMKVDISSQGSSLQAKYLDPQEDLSGVWWQLTGVERNSIKEAALCLGNEAYTASEFMSLRMLEKRAGDITNLSSRNQLKVPGQVSWKIWQKIVYSKPKPEYLITSGKSETESLILNQLPLNWMLKVAIR